jgi:tRNA-binding protein
VFAVVNLPPRQVADFASEALVLGVPTDSGRNVVLVGPDRETRPGLRLL